MIATRIRRTVLTAANLAASAGVLTAAPAAADTSPRLSTGGCITGIADTFQSQPVCRVITGSNSLPMFDVGIWGIH